MCTLQIISAVILVLVSNISLLSTESTEAVEENSVETLFISEASDTSVVSSKQPKTWDDVLREATSKWKPLPGSHFDENYRVVIDDPEVYQRALEKEQAKNKGKFDYQNIEPQEDPREQNIFYRLYKHNPILGILATIPLVCLAVVLLKFRDSFKKKK